MNANTRVTRECTFRELAPPIISAIRAHIAEYGLNNPEPDIMICCETTTTREKRGLFGKSTETTISGVFLTPQWLVWSGTKEGTGSAQLKHIDVHDFADSAMYAISPDLGLNITGRYTNHNQTGQVFIGLASGSSGQKFRDMLHKAIEAIKIK